MTGARVIRLVTCAFALAAVSAENAFAQSGMAGLIIGPIRLQENAGDRIPDVFREGAALNLGFDCKRGPRLSAPAPSPVVVQSYKQGPRPKVVATFPEQGAVVRPGLVVVRVTFDQPMACDASFDGKSDLPNPCPGRRREATLSQDRRSFRTVCEVKANVRYRLRLRDFRSANGPTLAHDVTFSTSGAAPVGSVVEALTEDLGGTEVAGG